jgi:hypothetical protein
MDTVSRKLESLVHVPISLRAEVKLSYSVKDEDSKEEIFAALRRASSIDFFSFIEGRPLLFEKVGNSLFEVVSSKDYFDFQTKKYRHMANVLSSVIEAM